LLCKITGLVATVHKHNPTTRLQLCCVYNNINNGTKRNSSMVKTILLSKVPCSNFGSDNDIISTEVFLTAPYEFWHTHTHTRARARARTHAQTHTHAHTHTPK